MPVRWFITVLCLFATLGWADIRSNSGNLSFDVQNDGNHELKLTGNGLALGLDTPSANLHVLGNAMFMDANVGIGTTAPKSNLEIAGTYAMVPETITADATLSGNTLVLVDSSGAPSTVVLSLPESTSVRGKLYQIKKTAGSHGIRVQGLQLIDQSYSIELEDSSSVKATAKLISAGNQWYVLSLSGNSESATLPTGNLQLWLDASDASTFTQSGNIEQWRDKSGYNRHAGQSASANQPNYIAGAMNGMAVVRFDGTDDHMDLGDLSAAFPSAATVFIVVNVNNDTQYNLLDTRSNSSVWAHSNGLSYPGPFRTNRVESYASNMPSSGNHIYALQSSATLWEIFVDGNTKGQKAGQYNAGDNYTLCDAVPYTGDIAEVMAFDSIMSESDRINVEVYLANKWGVENYIHTQAPEVMAALANDPDNGDLVLSNNDILKIYFDRDTNKAAAATKAQIDGLIQFGASSNILGADYTGVWNTGGNVLTITVVDATGGNVEIGQAMSILADGTDDLKSANDLGVACSDSGNVSGSWGTNLIPASNLQIWLDASDEDTIFAGNGLYTWVDKSGQGHNASGTSHPPNFIEGALNGNGVIRFDGAQEFLEFGDISSAFPSEATLFLVITPNNDTNYNLLESKSMSEIFKYSAGASYPGVFLNTRKSLYSDNIPSSGNAVIRVESASDVYQIWVNGVPQGALSGDYNAGDNYYISNYGKYDGDIAEIIAYDKRIDLSVSDNIETYLANKWGLNNHIKTSLPEIVTVVARDPDLGDTILSNGDELVIHFDRETNKPAVSTNTQVDGLIEFASGANILGADYTGAWDSAGNILTITIIDATGGNVEIGQALTIKADGTEDLKNASLYGGALATSANVVGSWGEQVFPMTNLLIWLDASDEDTFTTGNTQLIWGDKSGRGNSAYATSNPPTLTQGAINGNAAINFDGTQDAMEITDARSSFSDAATVFIAATPNASTHYNIFETKNVSEIFYYTSGPSYPATFLSNRKQLYSDHIPTMGNVIFRIESSAGAFQIWVNGVPQGELSGAFDVGTRLTISDNREFEGDLAELMIFNEILPQTSSTNVEAYLANKWGFTNHIYNSPPEILAAAARDPDLGDGVLSNGDELTIAFDRTTNQPAVATKADIDGLISFGSNSLGTNYTGAWSDSGNLLTITISDATGGNVEVGQSLSIIADGTDDLKNEFNQGKTLSMSANIVGSWGTYAFPGSNLLVWLDAAEDSTIGSGNAQFTWGDKSGHSNHAFSMASSPIYVGGALGGNAVIRLDGSYDYLSMGNLADQFPNKATIFMVTTIDNDTSYNLFLTGTVTNQNDNAGGTSYPGAFRSPRIENYTTGMPSNSTNIFMIESSSSNWEMYIDNVSKGAAAAAYDSGSDYRLGRYREGVAFDGDFAEVLIFNKIFSSGNRTSVYNYLKNKWGL